MADDLDKIIKIGLGILGGFILLDLLSSRCMGCGNKIPPFENKCPYCGAEK